MHAKCTDWTLKWDGWRTEMDINGTPKGDSNKDTHVRPRTHDRIARGQRSEGPFSSVQTDRVWAP